VPYKTLSRDIRAVIRDVQYATDNHLAAWNMNKFYYNLESKDARSGKNFYDIMAHAYKEGDTEAYQQMRKELAEIPLKSSFGVSQETITENIEKRGGDIVVGSQLWCIDAQAAFCLDSFNKSMTVEPELARICRKTGRTSFVPSAFEDGFSTGTKDGEGNTIKAELTSAQIEASAEESGEFAYRTLTEMFSSSEWKQMTIEEQEYAIKKTYEYSKVRSRAKLYDTYNITENVFRDLYSENALPKHTADKLIRYAKEKK
jgi:hypothetical protein